MIKTINSFGELFKSNFKRRRMNRLLKGQNKKGFLNPMMIEVFTFNSIISKYLFLTGVGIATMVIMFAIFTIKAS